MFSHKNLQIKHVIRIPRTIYGTKNYFYILKAMKYILQGTEHPQLVPTIHVFPILYLKLD